MNFSYLLRLVSLSLAIFFLVHFAAGIVISFLGSLAIRMAHSMAERINPRFAARFLLGLRLFPAGLGLSVVAGLCIPSYLRHEPRGIEEQVGWVCAALALLCLATLGESLKRVVAAIASSIRYFQNCRRIGCSTRLTDQDLSAFIVEETRPVLAVVGIVCSRVVISRAVVRSLSSDQLAAVLKHELAHQATRDNLKRLIVLSTPNVVPFARTFQAIDHAWAKFVEWAADDWAVVGDEQRSVSLAWALVRIARMGVTVQPTLPATSLLAEGRDLEARVDRLLRTIKPGAGPRKMIPALFTGGTVLAAASMMVLTFKLVSLSTMYSILECLIQ